MKLELAPRAVRDAERHARWWRETEPDRIRVVAIWGAVRERAPRLR